jgi:hypothetical protein
MLHDPPIFLGFITLIIFGEKYKLRSSWLYNSVHLPVTSSLLCPNILLSGKEKNPSPCQDLNPHHPRPQPNHYTNCKRNFFSEYKLRCTGFEACVSACLASKIRNNMSLNGLSPLQCSPHKNYDSLNRTKSVHKFWVFRKTYNSLKCIPLWND